MISPYTGEVMKINNLGKSGLRVSQVGLGCNNFGGRADFEASRAVIHKALEVGITFFDTADTYGNRGGSETIMGQVLGSERKNIVLASKFGWAMDDEGIKKGGSRRYIMAAVHDSLKRLQTDWLDLYQFHRPDPLTPVEETMRALNDLIRHGMVRYIGVSNMPAWQVVEAQWIARDLGLEGFVSCQDEYSLLARSPEKELVPAMQAHGLGLIPYSPLASGMLTGKYRPDHMPAEGRLTKYQSIASGVLTPRNWEIVQKLQAFCDERGHTLLELAFSWLAARPQVASVIGGATRPEQIEANVAAANWALTPEELAIVDSITTAQV